jgi:hypothetical protein
MMGAGSQTRMSDRKGKDAKKAIRRCWRMLRIHSKLGVFFNRGYSPTMLKNFSTALSPNLMDLHSSRELP